MFVLSRSNTIALALFGENVEFFLFIDFVYILLQNIHLICSNNLKLFYG